MKKSTVTLIISCVGIALAALIGVQIYWAYSAYRLTEKEFNSKVKDAMLATTDELNKQLACFELFSKTKINSHEGFYMVKQKWEHDQFLDDDKSHPDTIPMFYANANQNIPFEWSNLMVGSPVNVSMVLTFNYLTEDGIAAGASGNKLEKITLKNYRDAFSENIPIEKRFSPQLTDSLLKKNLNAASISDNFQFAFVRSDLNKIEFTKDMKDSTALLRSALKVPLTNSAYFSQPYELRVSFLNYSQLILAGIKRLLIASVFIVFILLVSFYLFARIILKQRKLSEMKNDFINNMTHEFKTPLTNISLALENIASNKPGAGIRDEKVLKIIGHETERLRENVDRILQVARFEKEKLHLSLEKIDLHQLIHKTVSAFEPVINGNGTLISCKLEAADPLINADETLLFNALYNVIDNGINYNSCKADILISTASSQEGVVIRIKDNGIGISSQHQKKIFENFYRVPQGNLHDVKGYGLGLSYVKIIVDAHRGKVGVNSQLGEGSEFEIYIPAA
ncbi:HAMP domain-containing sensor histidine kinase [soil metagenome]